jgi:uncharacterized LabA/DUF88 family protein
MDRSALFIDAGYLLAEGGRTVCGSSARNAFVCDYAAVTRELATLARGHSGDLDILRTYWYDGAPNGVPTNDHERIGALPYVKVRLGRVHSGQQKGVDALIYRDLMTLARERAIARAYLLSGDEDLREGVIAAQDMGVQVVLLGIPTSQRANQSAPLIRESDEHLVLDEDFWQPFFSTAPGPAPVASEDVGLAEAQAAGRAFATSWLSAAADSDRDALLGEAPRIPREIDAQLLATAEADVGALGGRQDLRREMRAGFWSAIREADAAAGGE